MKRMTESHTDWTSYIERKNAFFYISAVCRTYGKLLKDITGFRFTKQLHAHKNGFVTFYKSKKELEAASHYYLNLIKNKDPCLLTWHKKGLEALKKEKELIAHFNQGVENKYVLEHYDELVNTFCHNFIYLTTIPFIILTAIETAVQKGESYQSFQEMITLFEHFRKSSRNPLHEHILERIWKAAAVVTKENDHTSFSYFTPD